MAADTAALQINAESRSPRRPYRRRQSVSARLRRDGLAVVSHLSRRSPWLAVASLRRRLGAGGSAVDSLHPFDIRLDCEIQLQELPFEFVSIDQIKEAIEQLSFDERAALAAWLHGWKDDDWDEQMKRDIANGKLDRVLREVDEDIHAGRLREMP
jgi:hypothetical protein